MQKTITYLYPDDKKANKLKIFQDKSSQVRGILFARSTVSEVKKLQYSGNYAIYFLIDDSNDIVSLYVGQSENGIARIENHVLNKEFWSVGIMFITENNSFDKSTIDYLEWKFIHLFEKSSYALTNKEPNVSDYDKPVLESYTEQVLFLLSIENIVIKERTKKEEIANKRVFVPNSSNYKNKAKMIIKDGKFILLAGSELKRVDKEYTQSMLKGINNIIDAGKAEIIDGKIITVVDMPFNSPSAVAERVSGMPQNGWTFFKGLEEIREQENK